MTCPYYQICFKSHPVKCENYINCFLYQDMSKDSLEIEHLEDLGLVQVIQQKEVKEK